MTLTQLVKREQGGPRESMPREVAPGRWVGAIEDWRLRLTLGAVLAVLAVVVAVRRANADGLLEAVAASAFAWLVATALTDKYRHKYPYRYYSYLVASHAKSAAIQAAVLGLASWFLAGRAALVPALWQGFAWFVLADLVVSIPRRSRPLDRPFDPAVLKSRDVAGQAEPAPAGAPAEPGAGVAAAPMTLAGVLAGLEPALRARVRAAVPALREDAPAALITDRQAFLGGAFAPGAHDLLVSMVAVNDLRRINRFLLGCAGTLRMGGHLVVRYEPLEARRAGLERRWGPLLRPAFLADFALHRVGPKIPLVNRLYFALTGGKHRALSKAEVWGRLSFCGLKVVAEAEIGPLHVVTAQRIAAPITNRKPSYYPVVGLTKVGLDGQMLRTHKVRSMYPFSEFLQKQIFDAHGLVGTGKFKDDFRLTEYGKFLRRHWIDELPQIYDWLRGDIKLVGMRATSPHFLSLYPEEFIRRYVLVKPGLVPPLFPEGTEGFGAIVEIEGRYLRAYARTPVRADAAVLWETFKLIVFRGVRSK